MKHSGGVAKPFFRLLAAFVLAAGPSTSVRAGNLLKNPGMEDIDPETNYPRYWGKHWAYKGLWLVKQDAVFARTGSVCLGVHQAGPEAHKAFTGLATRGQDVRGKREFIASVWARGKGRMSFCVYMNSTAVFIRSIGSEQWDIDSEQWQQYTWRFALPETAERPQEKGRPYPVVRFSLAFHVKGGPVWFDDAALYRPDEQPTSDEASGLFDPDRRLTLTIPRIATRITVDGRMAPGEWAGAAGLTGFRTLGGGLSPRQWQTFAAFDGASLYVAFRGLHEGMFRKDEAQGRDKGFSSHAEEVEIWMEPPGRGWFQVIGLPSGAVMDQSQADGWSWSPEKLTYRSTTEDSGETVAGILTFGKTFWTAELAIPFDGMDLEAPKDGETWRVNFCRDYSVAKGERRTPEHWTTLSAISGTFSNTREFGKAVFRDGSPGVVIQQLGDLERGNLALSGTASSPNAARVGVEAVLVLDAPGEKPVLRRTVMVDVKAGDSTPFRLADSIKVTGTTRLKLRLAARDMSTGALLVQQEMPFTCMTSFRVIPRLYLVRGHVEVETDASRLVDLPAGITAHVRLKHATSGQVAVEQSQAWPDGVRTGKVRLSIASLSPGDYLVVASLTDAEGRVLASSSEPIPLPERPAWLGNRIGVMDTAPPPWTPIEIEGRTVRVTQREYGLADSGLPERLLILGEDVLTRPAQLVAVVDGKPARWTFDALRPIDRRPGWATWTVTGRAPGLDLRGTLRMEFDGFSLWRVRVSSAQGAALDSLALEFPLKRDFALHARASVPKSYAASLFRDPGDTPPAVVQVGDKGNWLYSPAGWPWADTFACNLWVGDDWRGLAVMCETDENIAGPRYCEFRDRGPERVMRVNLVSTPVILGEPLVYEYAYQATPVKPEPADPRLWHAAYGGSLAGAVQRGYTDFLKGAYILQRYWMLKWLCYPELHDLRAYRANRRIREEYGFKAVSNYHYQAIAAESPVFPTFQYEWEVLPRGGWSTIRGTSKLCCLRTSWQDFVLETMRRLVDEIGYDGIYTDSGPVLCRNPVHGCGYARDGERRPTLNLWATRETMKRIHTLFSSEGRGGLVFSHTTQSPCIAGFADVVTQGEEWGTAREKQYKQLTPDMFRSREARNQFGTPFTWYTFHQYTWRGQAYGTPVPFEDVLGMALLHRVLPTVGDGVGSEAIPPVWALLDPWWTSSEFIAYHAPDTPVSTGSDRVLASTFLKRAEKRALIVVFNWAYEPADARLVFDWPRLGSGREGAELNDARTGEAMVVAPDGCRLALQGRALKILSLTLR